MKLQVLPNNKINKNLKSLKVYPNIVNYEQTYSSFSWGEVVKDLNIARYGWNIAEVVLAKYLEGPQADKTALRCIGQNYATHKLSYRELDTQSNRFTHGLRNLGVNRGETVFLLTGWVPELFITALGIWKNGNIFSPLSPRLDSDAIHTRLHKGEGVVIITTPELYTEKIAPLRSKLPRLRYVVLIGEVKNAIPDTVRYSELLANEQSTPVCTCASHHDAAMLHFSSGTLGTPKGVLHTHQALIAHYAAAKYGLDLHDSDTFWCAIEPGSVAGTSYAIIAALIIGATVIVSETEFNVERCYHILENERVTVWHTTPAVIYKLMKLDRASAKERHFDALRFIATAGEALDQGAIGWGIKAFGLPIHDSWSQTEAGGITITNYLAMDIKPGSIGKPLPGIEAVIVAHTPEGKV